MVTFHHSNAAHSYLLVVHIEVVNHSMGEHSHMEGNFVRTTDHIREQVKSLYCFSIYDHL